MKIVEKNELNVINDKKSELLKGGVVKKTLSKQIERTINNSIDKELAAPQSSKLKRNIINLRKARLSPKRKYFLTERSSPPGKANPIKTNPKLKNKIISLRKARLSPKRKYFLPERSSSPGKENPIKTNLKLKNKIISLRKARLMPKGKVSFSQGGKFIYSNSLKGSSSLADTTRRAASGIGNVSATAANAAKSRALQEDKEGNTGVEGAKLGLRSADKVIRETRTIKNRVNSTVNHIRKLNNRLTRSVKSTKRTLKTAASSKRTIKTAAKIAQTSAKTAANTSRALQVAAKSIRIAAQITVKAAKAIAEGVRNLASLIAETSPWSLIIIAIILAIVLIMYIVNSMLGNVAGSVAGGAAWIMDSSTSSPQDMYKNLEKVFDTAQKAFGASVQAPLKSEIDSFCNGDTSSPYRMLELQYGSDFYFPANGNNAVIDGYLNDYGSDFYTELITTLFVLMSRNKRDISYTDIKQSDFEEFLGAVDSNSCKYGSTFVYKTTEITNCTCAGSDCETEYRDDKCAYSYDSDGKKNEYCKGHPYCPTHTKLQVNLYTIQKYTNKSPQEIYGFTADEKKQYETVKAFIQMFIQEYGSETSS